MQSGGKLDGARRRNEICCYDKLDCSRRQSRYAEQGRDWTVGWTAQVQDKMDGGERLTAWRTISWITQNNVSVGIKCAHLAFTYSRARGGAGLAERIVRHGAVQE